MVFWCAESISEVFIMIGCQGHMDLAKVMVIFFKHVHVNYLICIFLPSSAKIGWYKLSYCFKYFLSSDMTIWGHFHGVKIIFKVTACVILGYLVHWPPCMWWIYIISVWFIFELQLVHFIHNSKFGIYTPFSLRVAPSHGRKMNPLGRLENLPHQSLYSKPSRTVPV